MTAKTGNIGFYSGQRLPLRQLLSQGFSDLWRGACRYDLWVYLGWWDIRKHYTRSVLGPFWLTLSMGIMIGTLGVLYSQIFEMDISSYLPFLATGFILWAIIGGSITSACTVFSGANHSIRQVKLPLSFYIYKFVWMQFITFFHNFIIYIFVAIYFAIWPGIYILLEIPALILIALNIVFFAMLLGPISARFRDVPLIIGSLVQIAFFVTPILWSPDKMPKHAHFIQLNPFYHFMEIAREPLLGRPGALESWYACIAITIAFGIVALYFFSRVRGRIAYWV